MRWFIFLWPVLLSAQWSFDFEKDSLGQWNQSPPGRWGISASSPLNGLFSLHHVYDNPGSGEDYAFVDLNYPILDSSVSFSFRIRHTYNPSSGNNWQIYFLSQQAYEPVNAFVFGVNFKGSDDLIKLWQLVDGEVSEILNTGINYEEDIGRSNAPMFNITRDFHGLWKVSLNTTGDAIQMSEIGEGEELVRQGGKHLGVRYCYSSAQDRKLWLDDVIVDGVFYKDNDPPTIENIRVCGLNSLSLSMSESIILEDDSDFQWSGLSPDSISLNGEEIELFFPKEFPNREKQSLYISGISDLEENSMKDTLVSFMQNLVQFGEVVINEIMSDPEPEVYLPACEYIELLNLTEYTLNLSGWTMMVNLKSYTLDQGVIFPLEFLLLTAEDQECHYDDSPVTRLFSSNSTLSNSGGDLMLFDQYQRLIHFAEYKGMSYYSTQKEDGGWSLERIDPFLSCGGIENWTVSVDKSGGTPGKENSVIDSRSDMTPPELIYVGIEDENTVLLHFSESVFLTEEIGTEFTLKDIGTADPIFHTRPLVSKLIELTVREPLKKGTIYSINMTEVSDCEENKFREFIVEFMLPQHPQANDIIFNEIMYDGFIGQQEYIEFYNPSESYIDLKDLKYGVSTDGYSKGTLNWICEDSHLLSPGGYAVLVKNEISFRKDWDLDYSVDIVELSSWKSLPNESATLNLANRSDIILERFTYNDSMHHDLLRDPSGVSLERITDEATSAAWTSAAASVNYGTPGTRNSQWVDGSLEKSSVAVDPPIISPNMDGFNDICEVRIMNTQPGSLINIFITDLNGVEITRLIENGISGQDDRFFWDGHDMNRQLVLPGVYVIHIRIAEKKGEKIERHACAVTYR